MTPQPSPGISVDVPSLSDSSSSDAGHLPEHPAVRPLQYESVAEQDASATPEIVSQESIGAAQRDSRNDSQYLMPTFLDTLRSLASMIVVALFILTFIAQPFRIPSESMERTLLVGDFLLVNKMIYAPQGSIQHMLPYRAISHGDIIVFRFPLDPSDYVVKRVVGLPGDRIHLKDGVVYRNGQALKEPYAVYETAYSDNFRDQFPIGVYTDPGVDTRWWLQMRSNMQNGEIIVPAGNYFVLGDNRNHSRDSRYWGFVPQSTVVGRPFLIYFSLRQRSTTDIPSLPDDKIDKISGMSHDGGAVNSIVDFARWDRTLRVVR